MPRLGLIDIGDGVKQMTVEEPPATQTSRPKEPDSPIEFATKTLGLVDLMNKLQQAPLEQKIKEAEQRIKGSEEVLKQNQVDQIQINNEITQIEKQNKINNERREQLKFQNEQILNVRKAFDQGFEVGTYSLQQTIGPKAKAFQSEDKKLVTVVVPGMAPYTFPIGKITDPEKLNTVKQDRSGRYKNMTERYQTVYTQASTAKDLLSHATGESDMAAIYAAAKVKDPLGAVQTGDYRSVIESPNVPTYWKNMLTRALDSKGPVFGPANSPTRKNVNQMLDTYLKQEKAVLEPQLEFFAKGMVDADQIDPEEIMYPVGDLGVPQAFRKKSKPPASAPTKTEEGFSPSQMTGRVRQSTAPGIIPSEAGFRNNPSPEPPAPKALSPQEAIQKHNELRNSWLKSLQSRGNR